MIFWFVKDVISHNRNAEMDGSEFRWREIFIKYTRDEHMDSIYMYFSRMVMDAINE